MNQEEHRIQCAIIRWYRLVRRQGLIFAVPNGGGRTASQGAILKAEGVLAGVSDLIVVEGGRVLFVEVKTPKGRQQESQKEFEEKVKAQGLEYVLVRSLDEFMGIFK